MTTSIVTPVRRNWKRIQWAMLAAVLAFGAGCSGIHASKSVSPLDFILPGLMQTTPPSDQVNPNADSPPVLAKN